MKYYEVDGDKYPHVLLLEQKHMVIVARRFEEKYRIPHAIQDWLDEMTTYPYRIQYEICGYTPLKHPAKIMFMDREDAMKFKLAWA